MTQASQIPYAFFRDTLCRCGIFFDELMSFPICVEPPRSIRNLESALRVHSTRLNEFIASMRLFFNNMGCFKAAMEPIRAGSSSARDYVGSMYGQPDTLLRILLRIQAIQAPLLGILMDQMISIALQRSSEDEENDVVVNEGATVSSLQILNHIRWCEVIYDSSSLISLLLENVQIFPLDLQIEIISSIPALTSEISDIDGGGGDNLATELQNIAEASPALISCVLDTASNLCLQAESHAHNRMQRFALQLLNSADVEHLAVIIRYLLESSGPSNCVRIWKGSRDILSQYFHTCVSSEDELPSEVKDFQSIVISIIRTAFLAKPFLFQALLSICTTTAPTAHGPSDDEAVPCSGNSSGVITTLDLWVLYSLSDCAKYKSKIHTFLMKRTEQHALSAAMIKESMEASPVIIESIFSQVLHLASSLLGNTRIGPANACGHMLGSWLVQALYDGLLTAACRQEIVASLVTHAVSPNAKEADAAFLVLLTISCAEHDTLLQSLHEQITLPTPSTLPDLHCVCLRTYLPFLKSLLEDIRMLTENQQRALFRMLFQCAMVYPSILRDYLCPSTSSSSNSGAVGRECYYDVAKAIANAPVDDIAILLKKFSASSDTRLRRIAVCGLVSHVVEEALVTYALDPSGITNRHTEDTQTHPYHLSHTTHTQQVRDSRDPFTKRLEGYLNMLVTDSQAYCGLLEELCIVTESRGQLPGTLWSPFNLTHSPLLPWLRIHMEDRMFEFIGDVAEEEDEDRNSASIGCATITGLKAVWGMRITNKRMAPALYFDINGPISAAYIRIYDIVYHDIMSTSTKEMFAQSGMRDKDCAQRITIMCPVLRLVSSTASVLSGDLSELGVLLGAPIQLPKQDVLDRAEDFGHQDRQIICTSLLHCVDWIRTVLNSFSGNFLSLLPTEEWYKLLIRFNQLTVAEDDLYAHSQRYPSFLEIIAPEVKVGYYNPSTGKRVLRKSSKSSNASNTSKSSGYSAMVGSGDQLLVLDDVMAAYETILRPLSVHVCCLLGYGTEALLYTTATAATQTQNLGESDLLDSENDARQSVDSRASTGIVKLNEAAQLRLLNHLATCLETVSSSARSHMPTATTTRSLGGNFGDDNGHATDGVGGMVEIAGCLQQRGVFVSLHGLMNKALLCFGGRSSDVIGRSTDRIYAHTSELQVDEVGENDEKMSSNEMQLKVTQIVKILATLVGNKDLLAEFREIDLVASCSGAASGPDNEVLVPTLICILADISGHTTTSAAIPSQTAPSRIKLPICDLQDLCKDAIQGTYDVFFALQTRLLATAMGGSSSNSSSSGEGMGMSEVSQSEISRYYEYSTRGGRGGSGGGVTWALQLSVSIISMLDGLFDRLLSDAAATGPMVAHLRRTVLSPESLPVQLSGLCDQILQVDWQYKGQLLTQADRQKRYTKPIYTSKDVGKLMSIHLKWAIDRLVRIRVFTEDVIPDLRELSYNEPSSKYPTLSIATFAHFLFPLLQNLSNIWKEVMMVAAVAGANDNASSGVGDPTQQQDRSSYAEGHLSRSTDLSADGQTLSSIVDCFSYLIMLTKLSNLDDLSHEVRTSSSSSTAGTRRDSGSSGNRCVVGAGFGRREILYVALKEGRVFMEQFIRTSKGLHSLFSTEQQLVMEMLSTLQKSTRQLQTVASHGKRNRDKLLAVEGPRLKRVLESLIYRIKDMASDNFCLGAIWVGNLKHRRIDGTEIRQDDEDDEISSSDDKHEKDEEEDDDDDESVGSEEEGEGETCLEGVRVNGNEESEVEDEEYGDENEVNVEDAESSQSDAESDSAVQKNKEHGRRLLTNHVVARSTTAKPAADCSNIVKIKRREVINKMNHREGRIGCKSEGYVNSDAGTAVAGAGTGGPVSQLLFDEPDRYVPPTAIGARTSCDRRSSDKCGSGKKKKQRVVAVGEEVTLSLDESYENLSADSSSGNCTCDDSPALARKSGQKEATSPISVENSEEHETASNCGDSGGSGKKRMRRVILDSDGEEE